MSRRGKYLKPNIFKMECLDTNLIGLKNENGNADITSSEVVSFAAKILLLATKRGPVSKNSIEVFDEAI